MKLNKNIQYNFKNLEFKIQGDEIDFNYFVELFLSQINSDNQFISVLVNVKQADGQYFTIGPRFPLAIKDTKAVADYIEYLDSKHATLGERYYVVEPVNIIFNYTFVDSSDYQHSKTLLYGRTIASENLKKLNLIDEKPANLPLNNDYSTWGKIERSSSNVLKIKQKNLNGSLENSNRNISIHLADKFTKVIEIYTKSNILLNKVIDKITNPFGNEFIRQVGDKFYHIKNNTVYFMYENLYLDYQTINKARTAKKFNLNMLTLDIETYKNKDNTMSVYCASIYDGKNCFSFYLNDFSTINELMKALLKKLFSREYSQKTIYMHNSSNFDLIFLLKYIINEKEIKIEPIIKDGNYINIRIKYGPSLNYYVNLKDSYLILPDSLYNLTKTFSTVDSKEFFPHDFVNENNLNYIGNVPDFSFYSHTNLKYEDYNKYILTFKNNWNLKKTAIHYCEKDCIALYQVISKFSELIFKEFNINVSSISTLPSLAFKIFRANYLPKNIKLPIISGKIYSDISKAYFGGHCDVYTPTNPKDTLVYEYDCNSMFPFVMKQFNYPGKILAYFKGNIVDMKEYSELYLNNLSFLRVNIKVPKEIKNPILPIRSENVSIYGVGQWTGWYYSEELKNAEKYGYQYEILEGYIFKPSNIFEDYVNKIFQMKIASENNTPIYSISKLLLNTLYGRFGLSPEQLTYEVVDENKINERIKELGLDNVQNIISFENKSILSYSSSFSKLPLMNVGIAAAISANARVFMSQFKNNPNIDLLYTDTDSYFTLKPLPEYIIDNKKLGFFKIVHTFKEFVALAPKVYGGIDIQENEIVKTKGLKNKTTFSQLRDLLLSDSLSNSQNSNIINQKKWYSNLEKGTITEKDVSYSLKPTNNKRNLIYVNGFFVKTTNKEFN